MEIWWDKPVKTVNKVKKNKPDIVIWDLKDKSCKIVEVSVPLDTNLRQARDEKEAKYIPLISQLQQMFKFEIIPILTGALGSIPHGLKTNLQRLGIQKAKTTALKGRIQKAGLLRSIKARFSLIVAHFCPEIFYWLVQKIRSLSQQKPAIIKFLDQKYRK